MNLKDFGKVGVIYGGTSAERQVSIMSGTGVLQALRNSGVDAHGFDPAERNLGELVSEKFDRVFIALHGKYGEDGCLQGALELLKIPYTGSGVMPSAIAMDKIMTKRIWLSHDISTPKFSVARSEKDLAKVFDTISNQVILKPAKEGSSIGITKVTDANQDALVRAYQSAAVHDANVLVEALIQGRELTCAVVGSGNDAKALPLIEICAPEGNYDYQNKYFGNHTKYVCPAELSHGVTKHIQEEVLAAYQALGCAGWARIDIMLRDGDDHPFLIEINTSPGMTNHSLVPMAAAAAGISYEDLCVMILNSASLKNISQ